jgi:hypothetical protein
VDFRRATAGCMVVAKNNSLDSTGFSRIAVERIGARWLGVGSNSKLRVQLDRTDISLSGKLVVNSADRVVGDDAADTFFYFVIGKVAN